MSRQTWSKSLSDFASREGKIDEGEAVADFPRVRIQSPSRILSGFLIRRHSLVGRRGYLLYLWTGIIR